MVLMMVKVFEIVEGMVIVVPVADDNRRIDLAVEIPEASKPWSNLMFNNPLQMMCAVNLRNCSEVKMGVVDQASLWILCSLMKPDESAAIIGFW